jgi:MFS family permease
MTNDARRPSPLITWLCASTLNFAGSIATASILPVVVYRMTGDPLAVSALAVIEAVPYLVLGLMAGTLADRIDRRRIIVVGLTVSGGVAGVQSLGMVTGPHLPLIYGCALTAAVLFVVTDAAEMGLIPTVVQSGHIAQAWGISSALADVCTVAVPPVAVVLLDIKGPVSVLACDASSFWLAAALIARLRPLANTVREEASAGGERSDDWRAGGRFVWRHPLLRRLVMAGFFNSAGFGAVTSLVVVFSVEGLGLSPHGVQIGILMAAIALGRIAGGLGFSWMYRPSRVRLLSCVGTTGCACCLIPLAFDRSLAVAVVLLVGYGGCLAITITTGIVYRQGVAPDAIRSRVMTVGRMIAWGGQPLGAACAGIVARLAGVRAAYLIAAGFFCAAALVTSRVPIGLVTHDHPVG